MIAETEYHGEVEAITAPFKGLALGVFLISVGMGSTQDDRGAMARADRRRSRRGPDQRDRDRGSAAALFGAARRARQPRSTFGGQPVGNDADRPATALQAQLISRTTAEFWQPVTAIGLTITLPRPRGHDVARRIEMRSGDAAGRRNAQQSPPSSSASAASGNSSPNCCANISDAMSRSIADIDTVAAARRDGFSVRFADVVDARGSLDGWGSRTASTRSC